MAHYKVMGNGVCYGRVPIGEDQNKSRSDAQKIVDMHKGALNGSRKPANCSAINWTLELDQREYPFKGIRNLAD